MTALNTLFAGTLVLEPLVATHAAEMFQVLSDPAIYEFENSAPESVEWLERRYGRLESRCSLDGSQLWLNWVVRLPSGALAGYVQATILQGAIALVAYEFASRFWRQGIGSASVAAVLAELSASYGVAHCAAVLKARNLRSAGLLRHLSFAASAPSGVAVVECEADEIAMYRACSPPENAV